MHSKTGPSVAIVDTHGDTTPAGRDDDRDVRQTPSTPPPEYKDPPSYNDCVRLPTVEVSEEKDKEDDVANLEWDQDQSVEPHIVVNPMDTVLEDQHQASRSVGRRTDGADEAIEMSEMTGKSSESPEIMETSLIVPSYGDLRDQRMYNTC